MYVTKYKGHNQAESTCVYNIYDGETYDGKHMMILIMCK